MSEGKHATGAALDAQIAEEESRDMSEEENKYYVASMEALDPRQRELFTKDPNDLLMVIRGCAHEEHRMEETVKAVRRIAEWRDKVGYYNFFEANLEGDELFHQLWPEYICGIDRFGHFLQAIRIEEIDTDGLMKIEDEHLLRMQAYKRTMLIDLHNLSMSALMGKKKNIIKKVFDVSSSYFPETMFKIYLVNAPFVFRAFWAVVKPWLHPLTVAKVNILGGSKEALKKLDADGMPASSVPQWLGGTCPPLRCYDYLNQLIEARRGSL